MKKKLLITSSLITLLLALFPVSLYAEEGVTGTTGISSFNEGVLLDSYFYQNYDLLPFIEADNGQYINTSINGKSNLKIDLTVSDFIYNNSNYASMFGVNVSNANLSGTYRFNSNSSQFLFNSGSYTYNSEIISYVKYRFILDKNLLYLNDDLLYTFTDSTFNSNIPLYIFANNNGSSAGSPGRFKLYRFSIYDYDLDQDNNEIGYVRYYYPAKAKTSGVIGLYDAVSKTFISTPTANPFESPTDDQVIGFQISNFITNGLLWIGDILDFVIAEPMLLFFMAIGLAGAMFRWARRLVHF